MTTHNDGDGPSYYLWRGKPDLRKMNAAILAARPKNPIRPVNGQPDRKAKFQYRSVPTNQMQ